MRNVLSLAWKPAVVVALAAFGIGCGDISVQQTLALDGDNPLTINLYVGGSPTGISKQTDLSGGIDMTIAMGLLDIFNPQGALGMVTIDDVLFAGTSFNLLFSDTGTICATDVPGGGGTVLINIYTGKADFDVSVDVVMLPLGPLGGAVPGGLPFNVALQSSAPITFGDLLGMFFGTGGSLTVSQDFDTVIEGDGTGGILDLIAGSTVSGTLTLTTVDAFPSDPLLDECITTLGL